MIRLLTLPLLILPLVGCPALDVMEGKESPYKAAHEARVALVTLEDPEPVVIEPVAVIAPPAPPSCVETFRINRCGPDGEELPW